MLLIDAVQGSRFLTERKSNELILKLRKLTSKPLSKQLKKQVYVPGRFKMHNERVYYNLDALQEALSKRVKVAFQYFSYDFEKRQVLRKAGDYYNASPLGLVYVEENYYLIAFDDSRDDCVQYRVDRMLNVAPTDEAITRNQRTKDFDVAEYSQRIFTMFGGVDTQVELIIVKNLVAPMIDRFGADVLIYPIDDDHARVCVNVKASRTFFGWLAQFGEYAKIDKPVKLAEEYCEFLRETLKYYEY
jgi:predicted DNA-binding transcriptional regulator YafY